MNAQMTPEREQLVRFRSEQSLRVVLSPLNQAVMLFLYAVTTALSTTLRRFVSRLKEFAALYGMLSVGNSALSCREGTYYVADKKQRIFYYCVLKSALVSFLTH
jgi:hypothetical protein